MLTLKHNLTRKKKKKAKRKKEMEIYSSKAESNE